MSNDEASFDDIAMGTFSTETECHILTCFGAEYPDAERPNAFVEHGQWFVQAWDNDDRLTSWSVVEIVTTKNERTIGFEEL